MSVKPITMEQIFALEKKEFQAIFEESLVTDPKDECSLGISYDQEMEEAEYNSKYSSKENCIVGDKRYLEVNGKEVKVELCDIVKKTKEGLIFFHVKKLSSNPANNARIVSAQICEAANIIHKAILCRFMPSLMKKHINSIDLAKRQVQPAMEDLSEENGKLKAIWKKHVETVKISKSTFVYGILNRNFVVIKGANLVLAHLGISAEEAYKFVKWHPDVIVERHSDLTYKEPKEPKFYLRALLFECVPCGELFTKDSSIFMNFYKLIPIKRLLNEKDISKIFCEKEEAKNKENYEQFLNAIFNVVKGLNTKAVKKEMYFYNTEGKEFVIIEGEVNNDNPQIIRVEGKKIVEAYDNLSEEEALFFAKNQLHQTNVEKVSGAFKKYVLTKKENFKKQPNMFCDFYKLIPLRLLLDAKDVPKFLKTNKEGGREVKVNIRDQLLKAIHGVVQGKHVSDVEKKNYLYNIKEKKCSLIDGDVKNSGSYISKIRSPALQQAVVRTHKYVTGLGFKFKISLAPSI